MREVIFSADDFGMSVEVNEAIETACRNGLLSTASLMVAGPAAADAVERARRLPGLRVGLHLVVIEGPSVLPPGEIPLLVSPAGMFPSDQLRLGVNYFFRPAVRRQLAREIRAQFEAFARTGLRLDHANAHKHMHLHPTVGGLLVKIGASYGLPAVRIPCEPTEPLQAAGYFAETIGDYVLRQWTRLLRLQVRRAEMAANDYCFGIAWSGHMTADRVAALAAHLPRGVSEIYFHPATHKDALLNRLMPSYEHEAELAALVSPGVRAALRHSGARLITWADVAR
ncbi:hopanoid biosynthesis-associated protein HpnK [Acetobacter sp. AN02]|uniref:hopanoid biosynthesis-associated protein HpnK n=1 Tax=Acetobacter sp. AN02 TaxID=2894186 RepID=UPI0024345901|nr:hopanoid biosynthesis-associated protein HpnK [Acetobacter sp. AN02]MDG6095666.1 hopanoid biosynthesis-associated protein HpnK [Acetobacter sp. AN02]